MYRNVKNYTKNKKQILNIIVAISRSKYYSI